MSWECARVVSGDGGAMGQYRTEWLQEVAGNNRELGWTEKRIHNQLVLINTMSKSKLLLRALGKQFKDKHGHPSLKTSGATMPTSTGNRLAKLTRVITFVSVEGAVHLLPRLQRPHAHTPMPGHASPVALAWQQTK